ncbi:MAG TPA: hypothetical protein PLE98_01410, partial [Candidatus Dojkabacteria bacterium]|nr:hypothetical protein [Candidatus Dojkabacteria bacterium]
VSGTDNLSGARTVDTNIYNENNSGSAIIPIGRLAHDITPETLSVSYNAINIDVSSLESGIYTIRASIMDYAGNLKYATKQIEIDNTAPETIFTNEISGIFTNDPIQIEGESTDLHGVTQVKLQYKETTDTTWTDLVILSNTSENSPFIWYIHGPHHKTVHMILKHLPWILLEMKKKVLAYML